MSRVLQATDARFSGAHCPHSSQTSAPPHASPLGFGSPATSPGPLSGLPLTHPPFSHLTRPTVPCCLTIFMPSPTLSFRLECPLPAVFPISTGLDSAHPSRQSTNGISSRKPSFPLPQPSARVSSVLPLPTSPPGGHRPTTEENELLEERQAVQHLILPPPTVPAFFLTQVGVQTISDEEAQLRSKTQEEDTHRNPGCSAQAHQPGDPPPFRGQSSMSKRDAFLVAFSRRQGTGPLPV